MAEPFGIALIGCGTVGGGVAKLLLEQSHRLTERAGRTLELRKVVVRDLGKPRAVPLPTNLITTDVRSVLDDPGVQVGVELAGGTDWARQVVLDLLAAGKHVVTANKALLAEHGHEIFEAARRAGRVVAFEASVMGAVPIVAVLGQALAANQVLSLQGILNGTSNFILTAMTEQDQSYSTALAEAQALGYAEADPTLDVDGTDAAHKLAILAQLAFGVTVPVGAIDRRGIAEVHEMDIRFARELGYTIKLLGEAWLDVNTRQLALHVSPVLLRHQALLAQVRGAGNAIRFLADAAGEGLLVGRGAGQMPTASAVTADVIDLAVGRAQKTFPIMRLWSGGKPNVEVRRSATVKSRFYLRLQVVDVVGVMADVTRTLADSKISIASVVQHEAPDELEGKNVTLVIMTHSAQTEQFRGAVAALDRLGCTTPPSVYYPVAE